MKYLFLIIFLIPSVVGAANTMTILDVNAKIMKQISINANTDVDGVYFDGFYYWFAEGKNVTQNFLGNDGALYQVDSFDMSTADATISEVTAITGDGLNLWIAAVTVVGTEPFVIEREIYLIDKYGHILDTLESGMGNSLAGEWTDMTMDGLRLIAYRINGSGVNEVNFFDVTADVRMGDFDSARNLGAITWNGERYYAIRDAVAGQLQYILPDGTYVILGITTNIRATGMDFVDPYLVLVSQ